MFGQNFTSFGEPHELVGRLEDRSLWRGAVRVRWLDRSTVIVNDQTRRVTFFISQRGTVEVRLADSSFRPTEEVTTNSTNSAEEIIHDYWFDDPRALLISQQDRQAHLAELRRLAAAAQAEVIEQTKTVTLPLLACDFVRFIDPATGEPLLAAADALSQGIKMIDRDGWRIASEIGSQGTGLGQFVGISGIDAIRLDGDRTVLCTCDAELHRIQILDLSGTCLQTAAGAEGPKATELRRPSAIATHVSPSSTGSERPSWFLGEIHHKSELEQYLYDKEDASLGDFCLGQRVEDETLYDLSYLGKGGRVFSLLLRRVPLAERTSSPGEVFLSTSAGRGPLFSSIWHLILGQKFLRKPPVDGRPFAHIAVAEPDNCRVNIWRYYWTLSEIYTPSIEQFVCLGGIRKRYVDLQAPTDVSYSFTGELAICDIDKVVIIAPNLAVVKILRQAYSPLLQTREQREYSAAESEAEEHEAAAKRAEKMARGGEGNVGRQTKQADNSSVQVGRLAWPLWAADADAANKDDQDAKTLPRPCTVSFATDGKLAIGFKCGGVLLFKGYRSLAAGRLNSLPSTSVERVLSFCDYKSLESLRDCCRLLHNYTRDLRGQWRLRPMREKHHDIMIYFFLRWATRNTSELAFSSKQLFAGICQHHLETGRCPLNKSCPFSHDALPDLGFREFFPSPSEIGLELCQFITCCNSVYGPTFCYQQEAYILALFDEKAAVVPRLQMQRERPRYTPGGEVIRNVKVEDTKVLGIKEYILVMTWLEEDHCGNKPIHLHALFHRSSHSRDSRKPPGPYEMDAVDKRIYIDRTEQYGGGLKVSCVPLKERVVQTRSGMEDQTKGSDLGSKGLHVEAFRSQSERISGLCSRIFKK